MTTTRCAEPFPGGSFCMPSSVTLANFTALCLCEKASPFWIILLLVEGDPEPVAQSLRQLRRFWRAALKRFSLDFGALRSEHAGRTGRLTAVRASA
ncbi:MAG: hypothetical protein WB839_13255, partial [Pseudolabrys sp.]